MGSLIRVWLVVSLVFIPVIAVAGDAEPNMSEEDATLNITSNSEDGVVYINGYSVGKTPLLGVDLRPGKYRIEGKLENAPEVEVTLILDGDTTTDLKMVYSMENKGTWITRHSLLFGSLVGIGIYLGLFAMFVAAASSMN